LENRELYEKLKLAVAEIVNLKVSRMRANLGVGYCPYLYYGQSIPDDIDCNKISCGECTIVWEDNTYIRITDEVREKYGLNEYKEV